MADIFPPPGSVYAELAHELTALGGVAGRDFLQDRSWDGVTFARVTSELYDKWTSDGSIVDESTPGVEDDIQLAAGDPATTISDTVDADVTADGPGTTDDITTGPGGESIKDPLVGEGADTADDSADPGSDADTSTDDSADPRKTPSGTASKRSATKNTTRRT